MQKIVKNVHHDVSEYEKQQILTFEQFEVGIVGLKNYLND